MHSNPYRHRQEEAKQTKDALHVVLQQLGPDDMLVRPSGPLSGVYVAEGDKSVSHRALLLAAMAEGVSLIENLPRSRDIACMVAALRACGILISFHGRKAFITGGTLRAPEKPLYLGNAGTATRLLMGLLAGLGIGATFTGDESLSARPMQPLTEALSQLGAVFASQTDHLPITLASTKPEGKTYPPATICLQKASAQVKSALLLMAVAQGRKIDIEEPYPSRDHLEIMMRLDGAAITRRPPRALIHGKETTASRTILKERYKPSPFLEMLPGDPSSIMYLFVGAKLIPGSFLSLGNVLANSGRLCGLHMLAGAGLKQVVTGFIATEQPMARQEQAMMVHACYTPQEERQPLHASPVQSAMAIDEIPILAVCAATLPGCSVFAGIEALRHKECDRILAIQRGLDALGIKTDLKQDTLYVHGDPTLLQKTRDTIPVIDSADDHRIAMAFHMLGMAMPGGIIIKNAACVAVSFAEFFSALHALGAPRPLWGRRSRESIQDQKQAKKLRLPA